MCMHSSKSGGIENNRNTLYLRVLEETMFKFSSYEFGK